MLAEAERQEEKGCKLDTNIYKRARKDGDLWRVVARAINERGWRSLKFTKVKGHADEEDVQAR